MNFINFIKFLYFEEIYEIYKIYEFYFWETIPKHLAIPRRTSSSSLDDKSKYFEYRGG